MRSPPKKFFDRICRVQGEVHAKFGWDPSSSLAAKPWTDTQTNRQTSFIDIDWVHYVLVYAMEKNWNILNTILNLLHTFDFIDFSQTSTFKKLSVTSTTIATKIKTFLTLSFLKQKNRRRKFIFTNHQKFRNQRFQTGVWRFFRPNAKNSEILRALAKFEMPTRRFRLALFTEKWRYWGSKNLKTLPRTRSPA